jgi:hypothetical protein
MEFAKDKRFWSGVASGAGMTLLLVAAALAGAKFGCKKSF